MSVVVEFTIDADDFELGRTLSGQDPGQIELERIVPVEEATIPFFWVEDGDRAVLEADVRESDYVEGLSIVETVDDRALCRVDWTGARTDLVEAIAETEGTILEGRGTDEWHFRVRFPDHQRLSTFHEVCAEHGLRPRVQRVYTLDEDAAGGGNFGLTPEQREALLLALERGYLTSPREVTMEELAADLDISQQAFSERYRRGVQKVLKDALVD